MKKTVKCVCGRRAKLYYVSEVIGPVYACVCGRGISLSQSALKEQETQK